MKHVLEINHKVRESLDKEIIEVDVLELSSEINRLLHHSTHDLEAFIPQEIIEKMHHRSWFPGDTASSLFVCRILFPSVGIMVV